MARNKQNVARVEEEVVNTSEETEKVEESEEEVMKKEDEVAKEIAEEFEDEVTVEWLGRSRTFTKERNGKDFKVLAEQFAKKFGGKII